MMMIGMTMRDGERAAANTLIRERRAVVWMIGGGRDRDRALSVSLFFLVRVLRPWQCVPRGAPPCVPS